MAFYGLSDGTIELLHRKFISYTGSTVGIAAFKANIANIADMNGENINDISRAMETWGTKTVGEWVYSDIYQFCVWYKQTWCMSREKYAQSSEPQPQAQFASGDPLNTSMTILANVVSNMVAQTKADEIGQKVMEGLEERIDKFLAETYGPIERKVTLHTDIGELHLEGLQHEKFDTVLKFVTNNVPVYLAGPAGSGKNVICKQIADALGLEFYFTNAVTQEYKLTGFTDANGRFHESQFYKAFRFGGLFMLDEMDASIPEVLIILNAAIANRYFDFPAPIGKIEAHPDFRVVAAGNTLGYGADAKYVGRNTLDAASLDRFAVIEVDYDDKIALGVTGGNKELVRFCNRFRKAVDKAGLQVTVSYRAMERMAKMESLMSTEELLRTCLVKGMEKDDIHIVRKGMRGSSKYDEALQAIDEKKGDDDE